METVSLRPGAALRTLYGLAAVVVVLAGLKLGAPILVPIALALFLALLSLPLFRALVGRRVPIWLASLITVLVLLAGIAVFVVLILGSLAELRVTGPAYYRTLQERVAYTFEWWQAKGVAIESFVPPRWRDPQTIAALAGATVRGILALVSETTIVLLLLVFLLGESAAFPARLARMPARVRGSFRRFGNVSRELQRYLLVKTAMSAAVGVAAGAWVAWLDVEFAVLWGLIAFGCHFIPNVGAFLAAVPAMLVAIVQYDLGKAVAIAIGYFVIGLLLGNLAEPALLGRRLGLSTLAVFVSLLVWGWLWGPVGMFLSVPLTMGVRILLAEGGEWSWAAGLLDSRPGGGPPPVAPPETPEPEMATVEGGPG
jgi:predicted PurR-regulated permease PerM